MRSWAPNNHMVYLPWVMYIDTGKYIKYYIKRSRHSTSLLAIRMFLAGPTRSGKVLGVSSHQLYRISIYIYTSTCVCMLVWPDMAWCGMIWYGMAWYGMMWYGKHANQCCIHQNSISAPKCQLPRHQTERRLKTWRSQSWKWSNPDCESSHCLLELQSYSSSGE